MGPLNDSAGIISFFAICTIKVTFVFIAGVALAHLKRHASAAFRHQIWTLVILCALALPVLTLLLPVWRSSALRGAARFLAPAHETASPSLLDRPMSVQAALGAHDFLSWRGGLLLVWGSARPSA